VEKKDPLETTRGPKNPLDSKKGETVLNKWGALDRPKEIESSKWKWDGEKRSAQKGDSTVWPGKGG